MLFTILKRREKILHFPRGFNRKSGFQSFPWPVVLVFHWCCSQKFWLWNWQPRTVWWYVSYCLFRFVRKGDTAFRGMTVLLFHCPSSECLKKQPDSEEVNFWSWKIPPSLFFCINNVFLLFMMLSVGRLLYSHVGQTSHDSCSFCLFLAVWRGFSTPWFHR